jgi:DHA1 family bicyclomycin/chloramphenicol resistance-like MFS transporter
MQKELNKRARNGAGQSSAVSSDHPGLPGFTEFVLIVSALMGVTALSIDVMLPALGQIHDDYQLQDANSQQLVITIYLLGFAFGQIFYGPLSDRYGRKNLLLFGLGFYALASFICMIANNFEVLLFARLLQGIANAAPRILALAVVRDLYEGRRMAEVMSYVMMIFIVIPILAPSIGAVILMGGEWHLIFGFLALFSMALFTWSALRLPETHPVDQRQPLSLDWLKSTIAAMFTTRQTLGYTLTMGVMLACLFAYITMSQQIFTEVYETGEWFPILFGIVAASMIVSFFSNTKLVIWYGMRRISHIATVGFTLTALLHLLLYEFLGLTALPLFIVLLSLNLYFYGLTMPNFNALAMEPMGRMAGAASSFVGAVTTGISAVLSGVIAHFYAGTATPLLLSFLLCGLVAFVLIFITENGRMFEAGR